MRNTGDPFVLRVYRVTLVAHPKTVMAEALAEAGVASDAIELEPREVTLSYPVGDAQAIDRRAPEAMAEALRRAIKLERREYQTSGDTAFSGEVEFLRDRLIRPAA